MVTQKIEVIIYSEDKILIQDITLIHKDYEESISPILRIPSPEELAKINNACKNTLTNTCRD